MNLSERQQDVLRIIEKIDISPTMYKNAVDKYKSIAQYLNNHGIEADMYPQGSFALGTVVKPYSRDGEKNYDLDLVCQVKIAKDEVTPSDLRNNILSVLKDSDLYGGKLIEFEECFTIEYADINGIGFSIDIVPAADESILHKLELAKISKDPELVSTSIAIPKHSEGGRYSWLTNNPRGYKEWFDGVNVKYHTVESVLYRYQLFENNKVAYSSVEDIPIEYEKTSLQRVIQILKHHRNVYYDKIPEGDALRPISAIINTIVTSIAKEYALAGNLSQPWDLLKHVLSEFDIYSKHLSMNSAQFRQQYGSRTIINRVDGKWVIENPANPGDNLADKWNENSNIPATFFKWISIARTQVIDSFSMSDIDFRSNIENAFGYSTASSVLGNKYSTKTPQIVSSNSAKPWSM